MFTGLVEESGRIIASKIEGETARLTVEAGKVSEGAALGDSVAVNGCCLTVVAIQGENLSFDAVPETMRRTNLGDLQAGDTVNLERPLLPTARLGGHFVQGHIDGVGTVRSITPEQNAVIFEIEVPEPLRRYIIEKGSIAVDGISLTIASLTETGFTVWIIPHTREVTTLKHRGVGDRINLECDLLGKYVEHLMQAGIAGSEDAGNKFPR